MGTVSRGGMRRKVGWKGGWGVEGGRRRGVTVAGV